MIKKLKKRPRPNKRLYSHRQTNRGRQEIKIYEAGWGPEAIWTLWTTEKSLPEIESQSSRP
jgi:hypothetical protein